MIKAKKEKIRQAFMRMNEDVRSFYELKKNCLRNIWIGRENN